MTLPVDEKGAPPKKQVHYKFLLLCILLVSYFSYLSFQYDVRTGGIASALTWTFLFYVRRLQTPASYWTSRSGLYSAFEC